MKITAERLRELLDYDPSTGILYWRVKRKKKNPGDQAGCLHPQGYMVMSIDNKQYQCHQVAWAHFYGFWPERLDHKDTDRANNRIKNLREATHPQNCQNQSLLKRNKLGVKGVRLNRGKYEAAIWLEGKSVYLGRYEKEAAAAAAYAAAARENFGEFWRAR